MIKVLIFDTETTIDETQRFKFGFYQWGDWDGEQFTCDVEGIFYDPESMDAGDLATIHRFYVQDILSRGTSNSRVYESLTLDQFREKVLWQRAYQQRSMVCGFNLPFDLSRIAVSVSEARAERFQGGFSYGMWEAGAKHARPRLLVRLLDSKKGFIEWGTNNRSTGFSGNFLDLRTLAFSLSNVGHSLASACDAFNITHAKLETDEHGTVTRDYLQYARRDVQATAELFAVLMSRFQEHPIALRATKSYSPASMSKAYFRAMGIPEPLQRNSIPNEILGHCMTAFYGARAECRIRRMNVPVALCDFTSMYPTVNRLMRNWEFLTAKDIYAREATSDVQALLDSISLEQCFDHTTWQQFRGIIKFKPDEDILPVRSRYGKHSWNIGINYYTSDEPQWFAIPDVVASILLTGKVPTIDEAYKFECSADRIDGLTPVSFSGRVRFDPSEDDFFRFVIDERAKHADGTIEREFLKVLANAGCYGIFAEVNRETIPDDLPVRIYGDEEWVSTTRRIERPGAYAFPPIATCILSAARLMLSMLERSVTDLHGGWAFTDTDSMAIVSDTTSEDLANGSFRILSHAEVDNIRHRFNSLNPYKNVKDLLKLEYKGECYVISSKRYCLYTTDRTGGITISKYSSHGLGHLINPANRDDPANADWISATWKYILERRHEPSWMDKPAIGRYNVTQYSLLRSFRRINHGHNYSTSIKPSNFIIVAHAAKFQPTVTGHHVPIRSFELDSSKWLDRHWVSKQTGEPFTIDTLTDSSEIVDGTLYVKSYREVIEDYALHTEDKFATVDGAPCYPTYHGWLERVHIRNVGTLYLGKESNSVEQVQLGLLSANDETLVYEDVNQWLRLHPLLMNILSSYTPTEMSRMTGLSRSLVLAVKSGRQPVRDNQRKLTRVACLIACDDLGHMYDENEDPLETLTRWKDSMQIR